ncbi:TonB-dependent receptor [Fulvivirgaceae bacterium BMA10]|uniref:TonB-dependent receptor n=1 Tax=Splendidivirga corallicola TaxID=3051826 RepID=A0ABT8KHX4_9BACT|nr:TonB-dependent receptor [Fulvivirgaceae bacterium BMA10]
MKKFYLLLFCLLTGSLLFAQQRTVNGTIKDDAGNAIPGVNVLVKGTQSGTISDIDGKYSITVADNQNTLVFSYVGYLTEELDISGRTTVDVVMLADLQTLEEIVVIGYGTQKKINLTGSVEAIEGSELARQPVFQTSQALAGLAPGLVATQSSGQPGSDGATIRIRGIGTLGNASKNNPLILVDGIPDNINGVDPNDIESISVLKDASAAAIYGSRAANGVILITTKRGKSEKMKLNYSNYFGVQKVTQNLKFLDGLGYIENLNKANPGTYDQAFIDNYIATRGSDASPDTDWVEEVFTEDGFQQYHRLAISGGTQKARVSASLSYMDQEGNITNYDFKRYNGRINTDLTVSDKFDINFDLNFRRSITQAPSAGLNEITRQAYRIPPLFTAVNSDGSYGPGWNGQNPVAGAEVGGLSVSQFNYFRGVLKANYRPMDNLTISVTYAPQYNDNAGKSFRAQYDWQDLSQSGTFPNQNSLSQSNSRSFQDNFNAIANYSRDFEEHNVSATFGYEFLKNTSSSFSASRRNFVLQEFQQLSSGDADTQLNSGGESLNGLQSIFGRVNYSFKNKYLVEANIRRDASSRFAAENRVSVFPSFSVGWRIAEESFLSTSSIISDLKLRASWGELGNQQIAGDFPYVSSFNVGTSNPIIGGIPITGGAQSVLANRAIQWESTETKNIGLDAALFDSRLSLTAEYYVRTTNDILLQANTVPPSIGLSPPVQNVGSVENKGWDLALGWQDKKGDISYGVNFNISNYQNTVTDLGELDELPPGGTITRVGESIGSIFGYQAIGLFQSQDEIDNAPVQQFGAVQPGDVRYADQLTVDTNGDGIPDEADGIINGDDRVIIGNSLSRLNYGLDLFADYKGFDLSISLLGVGKRDIILQGDVAYAFFNAGKIQEWQTDSWTPENTDASYPRLTPGSSHNNWRTSTQWLFDASYLRVRNITLGYTLPNALLSRFSISDLRIYVSGQNLITFDDLPDGIDPTVPNFTSGGFYPITSTYIIGLNVSF